MQKCNVARAPGKQHVKPSDDGWGPKFPKKNIGQCEDSNTKPKR